VTAGAVFVGRGTVYHAKLLDSLIEKAVLKRFFGGGGDRSLATPSTGGKTVWDGSK